MKIEEYITAIERIREMHTQVGCAIAQLLGAVKGEAFMAKKMPGTSFMTIPAKI